MKITYRKQFIDEDPNLEPTEPCPDCKARGVTSMMEYMYINLDLAIYKCTSETCMYPHTNFKYKNYSDKTVYRLQVLNVTNPPEWPIKQEQRSPNLSDTASAHDLSSEFSPFFDCPLPQLVQGYSFQSQPVDSAFLDSHNDAKYDIKTDAMEKLESELHDLLSAHLDLGDKSPKKEPAKVPNPVRPPDVGHLTSCVTPTTLSTSCDPPPPKRLKLSKAYEFLERKLGGKRKSSDEAFKVPARPSRGDAHSTASCSGGERRHRHSSTSPRSHRKDYKLPKEVKSPLKSSQPSLFLKNIERQNVLLTDLNPVQIPIKIEVLEPMASDILKNINL